MEWFADNGWIAWLGLALVLLAVEVATVTFFFLMLAGGAFAGAVAAGIGLSFPMAVVVAVVVALVLTFAARPPLVRAIARSRTAVPMGAAALVGREGVVVEAVTWQDGRVELAGGVWSARSSDPVPGRTSIAPGHRVLVQSIDGATAVVAPLTAGDPAGPSAG